MPSSNHALRWLWLSLAIITIDLITKALASAYLPLARPVSILPFFNLTRLHNYGAAFSFLDTSNSVWQVVLFAFIAIGVSIGIIIWLTRLPRGVAWRLPCGLALILGGALGNLYNRIVNGYVVDFLDFHIAQYHWPAFNIADSAITIGAILVIWHHIVTPEHSSD